jgi:hypothetical protein
LEVTNECLQGAWMNHREVRKLGDR